MARMEAVFRAFRGQARGPYWWLWKHYPELVEAGRGKKRTDWKRLAELMAGFGIKTSDNRPLKPETVRSAWRRVRSDVAKFGYDPPPKPEKSARPKPGQHPAVRPIPHEMPANPQGGNLGRSGIGTSRFAYKPVETEAERAAMRGTKRGR